MKYVILSDFMWMCDSSHHGFRDRKTGAPLVTSYSKVTSHLHSAMHILNFMRRFIGAEIVLCMDAGHSGRGELSSGVYKAHRNTWREYKPSEAEELISNLGVLIARAPGYEADDVAATILERLVATGEEYTIILFSNDNDWKYHLRHKCVEVMNASRKDAVFLPRKEFFEVKYNNIAPKNLLFFRSIKGDDSDGIAPVRGVAASTAAAFSLLFNNHEGTPILEAYEKVFSFIEQDPSGVLEQMKTFPIGGKPRLADLRKILSSKEQILSNYSILEPQDCSEVLTVTTTKFDSDNFIKLCDKYEMNMVKGLFLRMRNLWKN